MIDEVDDDDVDDGPFLRIWSYYVGCYFGGIYIGCRFSARWG